MQIDTKQLDMTKKVTLYNVPFEYDSDDRVVDNDVLETFKVYSNFDDTGVVIKSYQEILNYTFKGSYMEGEINLNLTDIGIKGVNYIKLDGFDIRRKNDNKPFFYFLDSISQTLGYDTNTYIAKYDVFMSDFEELNTIMQGENVNVNRAHEDRYIWRQSYISGVPQGYKFFMNDKAHFLINSDFDAVETKGNNIIRKPIPFEGSEMVETTTITYNDTNVSDGNNIIETFTNEFASYNPTNAGNNKWYKKGSKYFIYAIVNVSGAPEIDISQISKPTNMSNFVIVPVSTSIVTKESSGSTIDVFSPTDTSKTGKTGVNSLFKLSQLQQGKVASIFVSQLSPSTLARNAKFGYFYTTGTRYGFMYFTDFDGTIESNLKSVEIPHIYNLSIEKNEILNTDLEIGIYNTEIIKAYYVNKSQVNDKKEIDMAHMFSRYGRSETLFNVTRNFYGDEVGLSTTISFGNNQQFSFEDNKQVSVVSVAGATYLANHANQIENARASANVNISHTAAKMANPFNLFKSRANLQELQQGLLEKKLVQDKINDAKNGAPSVSSSEIKGDYITNYFYKWANTMEYDIPNDIILNKIKNYFNKYGYNIEDYIIWNDDLIKSRSRFNYLQIEKIKDNIGATSTITNDIITEFDSKFADGVRLHWTPDFKYELNTNIERKIIEVLSNDNIIVPITLNGKRTLKKSVKISEGE